MDPRPTEASGSTSPGVDASMAGSHPFVGEGNANALAAQVFNTDQLPDFGLDAANGLSQTESAPAPARSLAIHDLLIDPPIEPAPAISSTGLELGDLKQNASLLDEEGVSGTLQSDPDAPAAMSVPTNEFSLGVMATGVQPAMLTISQTAEPEMLANAAITMDGSVQGDEQEEEEIFANEAEVPRIGGWIVPRRRPGATTPPRDLPETLIEEDPDDRPIFEDAAGSGVSPAPSASPLRDSGSPSEQQRANGPSSGAFMPKQEGFEDQPEPQQEVVMAASPQAGRTAVLRRNPLAAPSMATKDMADARQEIIRRLYTVSEEQLFVERPAAREDVVVFVTRAEAALDKDSALDSSETADDGAYPALKGRTSWLLDLGGVNEDGAAARLLLLCQLPTASFDVLELPVHTARAMLAITAPGRTTASSVEAESSPSAVSRKRQRRSDRTGSPRPSAKPNIHTEATSSKSSSSPAAPALSALESELHPDTANTVTPAQANLTTAGAALTAERDELRRQLASTAARLAATDATLESTQQSLSSAQDDARLVRSLYDEASEAARAALSEASEATERIEKLERQVAVGLAAHAQRYRAAQSSWREEERQLRDQVKLLQGIQPVGELKLRSNLWGASRAEDGSEERESGIAAAARLRKRVNAWHAWHIGEEERKRRRQERLERERREMLEEQQDIFEGLHAGEADDDMALGGALTTGAGDVPVEEAAVAADSDTAMSMSAETEKANASLQNDLPASESAVAAPVVGQREPGTALSLESPDPLAVPLMPSLPPEQ